MAKGDRRKVRFAGVTLERGNEDSREKSGGAPEPNTEASHTSVSTDTCSLHLSTTSSLEEPT